MTLALAILAALALAVVITGAWMIVDHTDAPTDARRILADGPTSQNGL